MKPVLVFQHNAHVPLGYVSEALQAAGRPCEVVKLHESPSGAQAVVDRVAACGGWASDCLPFAGIVSLGGSMGAYEDADYAWMPVEKRILRDAVTSGVPVLGICLGAQMLAAALGGTVFLSSKPEVGYPAIHLDDSLEGVSSGPGKLCSFHQDTFTLPPGATLLAKSDLYPQVFTLGSALAVQFHPEASPDIVKLWADRAVELRPMFLEKAGVAAAGVIADANAVEDVSKDAGMRLLSHWCTTLAA